MAVALGGVLLPWRASARWCKLARVRDEVFASLPLALVAFASRKGTDPADLLAAGGLSSMDVAHPDARVPYSCLPRIWSRLLELFPDEPLGLEFARYADLSSVGIVGALAKSCETLADSIRLYTRYVSLIDPWFRFDVSWESTHVRVKLHHQPQIVAMREPIETFLAMAVTSASATLGRPLLVRAVRFCHAQRHAIALYREVFGEAEIEFNAPWTGLEYPNEVLHERLPHHDAHVSYYLRAYADALVGKYVESRADDSSVGLAPRVHAVLDASLVRGEVQIEHVAPRLGMSTRSLQRGLASDDTSFRELLDEVRRRRAFELLARAELPMPQVALLLGYQDARNFYRSFRRWTGESPRQWRDRHRQ